MSSAQNTGGHKEKRRSGGASDLQGLGQPRNTS